MRARMLWILPSLVSSLFFFQDIPTLRSVANVMRASGCDVQQWMLSIPKRKLHSSSKKPRRKDKRKQPRKEKDDTTSRSRVSKKKNVDKKSILLQEFHSLKQRLRAVENQWEFCPDLGWNSLRLLASIDLELDGGVYQMAKALFTEP